MKEIWKDIKNFEGLYQVSNLGNVRSLDRISVNSYGMPRKLKRASYEVTPKCLWIFRCWFI